MIDMNHATFHMGEYAKDITTLVKVISKTKNRKNSQDYINAVNELITYYTFNIQEEYMKVDLLLEKNQILQDIIINKDMLISFARAGMVVVQREVNR